MIVRSMRRRPRRARGSPEGLALPYGLPTGTTTDYDQGIDLDDTKLNGGAPGAASDRRRHRLHRPEETGARSAEGMRAGISLEFHPNEYHLRRGTRGGRLHGLDRQAPVLFHGGRPRRQGLERLLFARSQLERDTAPRRHHFTRAVLRHGSGSERRRVEQQLREHPMLRRAEGERAC